MDSRRGTGGTAPGTGPGGLWTRLGLRARVTVLFGAGALLLSVSMGGLSYFTARHFLVGERESTSVRQAYASADLVRNELHLGSTDVVRVVSQANSGSASNSVLFYRGKDYASSPVNVGTIPTSLRQLVDGGSPGSQPITLDGSPQLVVGVPIPSVQATYFEVFNLGDLAHTLRVLALALAAAGIVTTVLGAALGRSASGRSLRPLTAVSRAAVAIADGRLHTRLPAATDDPDLAGLTTSFNRMVDQLQERIEREARFTSDVSHELRSPLTTLSATLDVLEHHRNELSGRAQRALLLLGADLRRFQRMVADLLEISRSDTGSADVSLEEVETGELVRRAVASSVRGITEPRPPLVEVDPAINGARIRVDKRRFERVMANLLENAAHYGGGATRVVAEPGSLREDGALSVRVSVEDHGPGVAPSERARVFERFYRGHEAGRRGTGTGTGLGLALVAEHVRLNGGEVWAEETDGGGARFTLELPVISESVPW